MPVGEKRAKYLQEIAETCLDIAKTVDKSLTEGFLPVVLGGDHSIAAGVAAGVASFYRQQKKEIGYIWLDAHGDMNTPESSPSGNVHGMPLAAIMGYGAPELVDLMGFKPKAEPGQHRDRRRSRFGRAGTQDCEEIGDSRLHDARHR